MISKVISLRVMEGDKGTMPWGSRGSPPVKTNKLCVVQSQSQCKGKGKISVGASVRRSKSWTKN